MCCVACQPVFWLAGVLSLNKYCSSKSSVQLAYNPSGEAMASNFIEHSLATWFLFHILGRMGTKISGETKEPSFLKSIVVFSSLSSFSR